MDVQKSQSTEEGRVKSGFFDGLAVIIPTWKAEHHWPDLKRSLDEQGVPPDQVLIIDSSSPDRTVELASASGYHVVQIAQSEFGHGKTRQHAATLFPDADCLLYMTQDAILSSPDSIARLRAAMEDPTVGAAYGRQLPRVNAEPIERHARLFNYPDVSQVRSFESRHALGIRSAFLSNSFAIYRRSALEQVGGFPPEVIFGEDSYVAARMLMAGWKIVYQADAMVLHSHPLSMRQEFKRYFDIGVHHERERWLLKEFGTASGEGWKFVQSELRYLRAESPLLIPAAISRTVAKLFAYRLGRLWRHMPVSLNRRLSSNPVFWKQEKA